MKRMFSKKEITNLVNKGIQNGEVKSYGLLLSGYFEDMDGFMYQIFPYIHIPNSMNKYWAKCLCVTDSNDVSFAELEIDFENSQVLDGDTPMPLNAATIELQDTSNGKIISSIDV